MVSDPPEGWYPDPQGLADERYFDGKTWTDRTRRQVAASPPSSSSATATAVDAWGRALGDSAGRVASIAEALAWLFLVLGGGGALVLAFTSLQAIGNYYSALRNLWPYTLSSAAVLLANAVVLWLLLRFIGIVAEYVAFRAKSPRR